MTFDTARISARAGNGNSTPPASIADLPCSASSTRICSTIARDSTVGCGQLIQMAIQMLFDLTLGFGHEAETHAIAQTARCEADCQCACIPERIQQTWTRIERFEAFGGPRQMILFFDGSMIKHGPQRRRPGSEFLSLVKRLGAHLADVVHTHQTGRMRAFRRREFAGSAADSCGTGNGRLIRDTPVIERKPRSNSLINSSRNIQHPLIRQPPRRTDRPVRQGFAGQNRLTRRP